MLSVHSYSVAIGVYVQLYIIDVLQHSSFYNCFLQEEGQSVLRQGKIQAKII